MTVAYYRISDGKFMGSTSSPGTINVELELSHWGPGVAAMEVSSVPNTDGKTKKVVNGQLVEVDNQAYLDKKAKIKAAESRVKQKLGITDEEYRLLFGG